MSGSRKVFITGATGYIGERLCNRLLTTGAEIHALVRDPGKADSLNQLPDVKLFKGDILNKEDLLRASEGCSQTFHIAGFVKPWHRDPNYFHKVNVLGTQNVLEASRENGVEKFVFTSTAGVFGPSNGEKVTEDSSLEIPLSTNYEKSKAEAERLIKSSESNGLNVVIVNPTRVYGPGIESGGTAVNQMISRYRKGKWRILPGDGNNLGNYVHVEDVVTGHILAMEKGRSGENYLLGGETVSYRQFFNLVGEEIGKNYNLIPLSSRIIIFASYLLLWQAELFKIPPIITPGFAKKYTFNWDNDSNKAIQELGYNPRPLKEGIRETLNWLNQN